jgi:sporulation protein YlmC with PRC-barrel domain
MVGLLVAAPIFAAGTDQSRSMSSSRNAAFQAFNASDLMGKTVKNSKGEELGKVEDLVIGSNGRADFVVLEHGGVLGVEGKYVLVPYQTFMNSTNIAKINTDHDLTANLDKARFDAAPTFSDKKWDLSNTATRNKVCSYYGPDACPHM